jgi:hypothetical protein
MLLSEFVEEKKKEKEKRLNGRRDWVGGERKKNKAS